MFRNPWRCHSTRDISMTVSNWRSELSYDNLREPTWHGFAWEYLRRNGDYQAQYADRECRAHIDAGVESQRCWGLRFRG